MNKVYKLVWNASIGVWVAVSELAKSKVKSKTIKVSAAVILVHLTVGMETSYADDVIQGNNIQVITDNSDPLNIKHTISTLDNVNFKNVAVGSVVIDSATNKISGLSDGVNNDDAATFGQLQTVDNKVSQNSSDISSLNSSVSKNTSDISSINSSVSKNTGDISSLGNRVTTNEGDIVNLQSSVGGISNQTWKIQANGDAASSVKASDTVQFNDGANIAITRSGNNLTVATKPEVSFDKVTVDGVVLDNGQITVTKNATVGSGSKEVVTGDQLYQVEQDLLNAGIERAKYFHATSVLDDSVADGTDSVAVGPKAVTNIAAKDAVAIGNNAVVGTAMAGGTPATDGIESIAIGKDTKALGNKNTVIGQAATTDTMEITSSIAIGDAAKISGNSTKNAIAIGSNSIASAANASAFGTGAEASATNATAIGQGAKAASGSATAVGDSAIASGANATALGSGAQANSSNAISLGANAGVGTANNAGNSNQNHIAIGTSAGQNIKGNENIAIGLQASNGTSGNYNIAIGSKSGQGSAGEENVSIGYLSNQDASDTDHTTAIGGRSISGQAAVAVGYLANADNQGAVAIGSNSKVEGIDDGSGTGTKKNADNGVVIGTNAWAKDNSIALGSNSVASKELAETQTGYLTSTKTSNQGVVSVGSDGSGGVAAFNRRIAHVDDGADGYDAVNVRQLKIAQEKVGNLIGGDVSVDNNGNYSQITLKDNKGNEFKYNTVVDALGAISSGAVLPSVDNAVTYTDATSKQINLRPNTVISGLAAGKVGTDAVNLAQMQEAVEASRVKYISVKSEAIGNKNNEGASGVDAVAIGPEAIAQNKNSTAIGSQVYALGDNATTIGSTGTIAYDAAGVAIGQHAISRGENSIVIGKDAKSEPQTTNDKVNDAIAVGSNALVTNSKGIAIGKETIARGEESIAQGYDARASADRALAVGVSSRSSSTDALALGTQASASGTNALATGKQANANARDSIATGTQATTYASNAIAMGNNSISGKANPTKDEIDNNLNSNTIAIGTDSLAKIQSAIALGNTARATEENTIAVGKNSKVEAKDAIAIGLDAQTVGANGVAIGKQAKADGENALAQGVAAKALNINSIAQGNNAQAIADNATAIGANALATGNAAISQGFNAKALNTNTIAQGTNAQATAEGATAIGANTVVNHNNAVALGSGSQSADYIQTTSTVINGKTYSFAGTPTNSSSVSVGSAGNERTIVNIAAGRISSTSTDAINGSQLHQTNTAIEDLANTALTFQADSGANVQRKLGETLNVVGGITDASKLTDNNIGVVADGNNKLTVKLAKDVNVDSVNAAGTLVNSNGLTFVDGSGNAIANSPSISKNGISAGNQKITNLAKGDVNASSTDAVNGSQLNEVQQIANKGWNLTTNNNAASKSNVAPDGTVDISNADSNLVISNQGNNVDIRLANQVTIGSGTGSNPVTVNGVTGRINGLSNTTWDPNASYNSKQAATEEQLKSVSDVAQNANKGWNVKSDSNLAATQVKPTDTVDIGLATGETNLKSTAVNDGKGTTTIDFSLSKDLNVDSVNAAGTLINSNGLSFVDGSGNAIANSPSISKNGISAGNQKITNLAKGDVNASSIDAVNGSQLNEVQQIANKGWNLTTNNNAASKSNVAPDGTVDISNADSNLVISNQGNNVDIRLANQVTIGSGTGSNPVTINGITGRINGLSNTTWDPNASYNSKQAATEEQLKSVSDVAQNANKGWNVKSDSNLAATQVKPTDTVDIGLATGETNLKSTALNDGKGTTTIDFSLSKDLNIDTVTAGTGTNKTVLSQTGVNIENGTTQTQLEAGKVVVKNTANTLTLDASKGTLEGLSNKDISSADFATQGRAATEEQLKQIQTGLTDTGFGLTAADGNSVQKKLGQTVDVVGADSNITTKVDQGKLAIELAKDVKVDSVNAAGTLINSNGLSFVDGSGNAIANSPSISKNGINAGNQKITNVAKGDVNATSTDAVNGSQLNEVQQIANKGWNLSTNNNAASKSNVAPDATVDISNADSNLVISNQGNNVDIRLANQVTIGSGTGSNPVTVNGVTGRINGLSNTTWDPNASYNSKQAATEEQLKSVSDVAQNANKGWNVKSDSNLAATQVQPTDTVDIGLATGESNLKSTAVNDGKGTTTIDFSLSKDLNIDTVTAGTGTNKTVLSQTGVNIQNGTTQTQLEAGKVVVKNTANTLTLDAGKGTLEGLSNKDISSVDFATQGRAATEEQLKQIQTGLTDSGFGLTAADGNSVQKKLGQTVDVVGADSNITTKVDQGKLAIELSKDLAVNSVNAAGTLINSNGLSFVDGSGNAIANSPSISKNGISAGNQKITNVAKGDVNASSTDAVNGSQLFAVGDGVKNIIGGTTTYDPNTGTFINNNIGNTGESTIHDAIKSVNNTVQTVSKGWNLTTNGQNSSQVKPTDTVDFANKDGNIKVNNTGNNVTVDLAKDIKVDSVQAGNTTLNNNGLSIKDGPSVTQSGIDAANKKITNVAEGSIAKNSKDAVNGSQLHDMLGDGAFVGGDGNTITNIGGTGATNINDAISSINQKAGQHSTVVAGQNMTVTETVNSSGGKEFKVATNDDVTFKTVTSQKVTADNVTVGDVQITKAGINAGNKVISNVADGAVNSTSKEAVNGSQLNTSNQYITKSLGGGAKYENGKFTEPTYNVNNGSYNNVGDALGALNQANINIGNQINNLGDRIEQVFYETNGRIDNLEEKMSAGIAANAALEQAPYVAGKVTLAVGAGYYNNQNAVGVTLRKTADNGRWSLTSGAALGSQGGALVRVGVSTVLD